MNFKIKFYEEDGKRPVREFILTQDKKMRAVVARNMMLLEEFAYQAREPLSKHLDDGIFELRCQQGNNITRLLYFFVTDGVIVFTNGFVKKTQKTPKKEIELAKERRKRYFYN